MNASAGKDKLLVTRSQLLQELTSLGVSAGQTVMLHVSVSAIGWIVGGPDVVLGALLDILTHAGTLLMYVSWEDSTEDWYEWSPERQEKYLADCPAFDPRTSRAYRKWSILGEYLRTWPGAQRSANPGASMVAVGAKAGWITADHPLHYGYGPGSPLAKLCEVGGKVLMLGAPFDTVTLLHYAEHLLDIPGKRKFRYRVPVLKAGERVWVEVEEYDTASGIVDWQGGEYFPAIIKEYLASGKGECRMVGSAPSYLFDAADLVGYALGWMKEAFTS